MVYCGDCWFHRCALWLQGGGTKKLHVRERYQAPIFAMDSTACSGDAASPVERQPSEKMYRRKKTLLNAVHRRTRKQQTEEHATAFGKRQTY